jgi:hypothetical protein
MKESSALLMRSVCIDFSASSFSRKMPLSLAAAAISMSLCSASRCAACAWEISRSSNSSATPTITMTVLIDAESRVSLLEKNPSMSSRAFSPTAEAREPSCSRSC